MKKLFLLLVIVLVFGACGRRVQVNQPVIIGSPGRVYDRPTNEEVVSVQVTNNTLVTGDVLVGETLVHPDLPSQGVMVLHFTCDNIVRAGPVRIRWFPGDTRNEYVSFRPQDGHYGVVSRSVRIDCDRRGNYRFESRTIEMRITRLPPLRR